MICSSRSRVCAMLTCMAVLAFVQMAEARSYRRIKPPRVGRVQRGKTPTRPTPAPKSAFENDTVYRAQLRVKTANVKDAGTGDPVMVRLGSVPGTWLDLATDDRERGKTNLYDIGLFNVGNRGVMIRDIRTLNISKTGSNGWCIESLELIVNGSVIYQTKFPRGKWLDNSKGKMRKLLISSTALRANAKWKQYKSTVREPNISQTELEQRIESIIGHHIHSVKQVKWGKLYGRGVEVSYKNSSTLHVDLDLQILINNFPNAALDVDFDIKITSRNGAIDLTVVNFKSRIASNLHKSLLAASGFVGGPSKKALQKMINEQVRQSLGGRSISVSTGDLTFRAKATKQGGVYLNL